MLLTRIKKDITKNHEEHHNYVEDLTKKTQQDYFISTIGVTNNICCPLVRVNNFKLKLALIYKSLAHLKKFLRLADIVKINNVLMDTIYLRPFPFSLADKALEWLTTLLN
ncbi:hypothetical protein CR513_36001, partial [Mucuna pruriens]